MFNPAYVVEPLSEDFKSDADWFLPFLDAVYENSRNPDFQLDQWQREALRRALEVFPEDHPRAGELRFRQFIIMIARQNGKSVLGAAFGLYGLIRGFEQLVVGVASSSDQARIVYDRTLALIKANEALAKRFEKLTETRGIRATNGSSYEIKASKGAALQGLPIAVGIVDEAHITKRQLYDAMVSGTGGRKNGLVVCITTAGDENSELLIDLYERGKKAAQGIENEDTYRFGCIIWEAPEAYVPEDPELFEEYLFAANPALQEGRLDKENLLSDIKKLPRIDIIRYHFNRFVSSLTTFISVDQWLSCKAPDEYEFPKKQKPVFAIDRSPDWGYATITANVKDEHGKIHTTIVASIVKPNKDQLLDICRRLAATARPLGFAMDTYQLNDLGKDLKNRGIPIFMYSQQDIMRASATLYAKIVTREMIHTTDPLVQRQIPYVVRRNIGDGFRISRQDSSREIDAVIATAIGVHAADNEKDVAVQLF